MKRCCTCAEWKEESEFNKNQRNCRACAIEQRRIWGAANIARVAAYGKAYRGQNAEATKQRLAAYASSDRGKAVISAIKVRSYLRNPGAVKSRVSRWRKNNPHKRALQTARRKACELQAMPEWANTEEIENFYVWARIISRVSGVPHHVDHIVPLQGRNVCGLHCDGNLQILTAEENCRKGNKFAGGTLA